MANVTTTTAATMIPEVWRPEIEMSARDVRAFSPRVTVQQFEGPGDIMHFPILGSISAAAFSGTVSYTANTESELTITPATSYAAVQLDDDAMRRALGELMDAYTFELGRGLAEYEDEQIAAEYANFSNSVGSASDVDQAGILTAIRELRANGKDKIMGQIYGIYHTAQWDHVAGISAVYDASVRGEGGLASTGQIRTTYGVELDFTGNVGVSTTARNLLFVQRAIVLARKKEPMVETERDLDSLSTKVVATQDFGVGVLDDNLGVVHLSNAS